VARVRPSPVAVENRGVNSARARLRARLAAAGLSLLVLVTGVLVTGALVEVMLGRQRAEAERTVSERATIARWAVSTAAQRYTASAEQLAAAIGAAEQFDAADLDLLAAPVAEQNLAGISGLALAVAAQDGEIARLQARWRALGSTGLTLAPAEDREQHVFSVANVPLDGHESPLGRDLTRSQTLLTALDQAQRTGRTAISEPYVLLRDQELPLEQQQLSVAVVAPVPTAGPNAATSWVLLGLRVQDMATAVLPTAAAGLVDITLEVAADTADQPTTTVASVTTGAAWAQGPEHQVTMTVGQQQWLLRARGTTAVAGPGYTDGRVLTALLTGALITGALILLLNRLLLARRRALATADAADADRRRAEHNSERGAGLLAAVLDGIGDGVLVADRSGRIVLQNRAATSILGNNQATDGPDTWQRHYRAFLPDGRTELPVDRMPLVRALNGERTDLVDLFIRNPDRPEGVMISVSGRPLDLGGAQPERWAVAVFHDVTARRRLEASLRAEHDRYQRLLQALSDLGEGVLVTSGYAIVYANEAYAQLLGYTVPELLDLPSTSALAGDEDALSLFADVRDQVDSDGLPGTRVTRLRHRDGEVIPVEAAALHVQDDEIPDASQRVYIVRDLSERRRWELDLAERAHQLQEANRQLVVAREAAESASAAKSDFLQAMSHEIRTPLNGVLGFTSLLAQSPRHPEAEVWARAADEAGQVLLDLVNNGLDLAKIEAGRITLEDIDVDLARLAREALLPCRLSAERTGIDLRVRIEPTARVLRRGDPTRLRQVMTNLVANAVKFTSSGSVTLSVGDQDEQVRLDVTDTGIGMTVQQQEQLFSRFQQAATDTTRRYGGSGLGLYITHGLVEAMQGTITVTSTPGQGSSFTVVLPLPMVRAAAPRPSEGTRRDLAAAAVRSIPRQSTSGPEDRGGAPPEGTDHSTIGLWEGGESRQDGDPQSTEPQPTEPPPTEPQPTEPPPTEPESPFTGLRVLVAEDNPTNQLVARAMLQSRGLLVDIVENGEQAVGAALSGRYRAVFMDCRMPVMDGFEATRRIRAADTTHPIRIVAMTANAFEDDRQACLRAGMDDFLPKPWKTSQLTGVLERLSALPQESPEAAGRARTSSA